MRLDPPPKYERPTMTKKTKPKTSAVRPAKTAATGVQLSEAQLAQAKGGLNFTKITYDR
jgi:hypothetical protein